MSSCRSIKFDFKQSLVGYIGYLKKSQQQVKNLNEMKLNKI